MHKTKGFSVTAPTGAASETTNISFDKTHGTPVGVAISTPYADTVAGAVTATISQGDYKPVEKCPLLALKPDGNREFVPIEPLDHSVNIPVLIESTSATPAGETLYLILFFEK